jgi:molybdate transport system substrate-binding protein
MRTRTIAAAVATLASVILAGMTHAAEIHVLSTNGVKTVVEELAPQFEKATGHKLVVRFAPAAELKGEIEKGAAFDLAILTAAATDDLLRQKKLASATRADVAKSGAGVAYRKGAPRPDISNADAFKRTLLAAKSVAYVGVGATAANMTKIFERFGIAAEMKAKTRVLSGVSAPDAVAKGEAELGFTQISEILPVAGAELAGPLPPEVQVYTVFAGAVGALARQPAAAESFLKFLTAPAASQVIKAKGMERS